MSKIFKHILSSIIHVWSMIYSYHVSDMIRNWRNTVYSMWIFNFVCSAGRDSRIFYPCKLWGGGSKSIFIGSGTTIQSYCILGCWIKYAGETFTPSIKIGDNCNIGEHTHITSINKITIGNGLLTGRYVYIGDNSHGGLSIEEANTPPIKRKLQSKGEVVIGNNVWIGDKATILAGVHIGDNVIIGANSVVTKDIPSNCMAAGMPAKVIKQVEICQNQD